MKTEDLLEQFADLLVDKLIDRIDGPIGKSKGPLTVTQFREAIGCNLSEKTIRTYVAAGRIARVEESPKVLIPYSEVERFNS